MGIPDRFYKSVDIVSGSPQLSTIEIGIRITSQSLRDIIKSRIMVPNTRNSNFPNRLCVSYPLGWYAAFSYRPNGLFFETNMFPDYAAPFDIMNLTEEPDNTLATNSSRFIQGYEKFLFPTVTQMADAFSCPAKAERSLNEFRISKNQPETKTSGYNEVAFFDSIDINPLALYGPGLEELAKEFGIDYYPSILEFSTALLYSSRYWRKVA